MTTSLPAADFMSPSLAAAGDGDGPAYELKFLLPDAQAHEVEAWARRHLTLDPHAAVCPENAYEIHGLYLDTPELDTYHRRGPLRRQKFRLRRYGSETCLYLERKRKNGDRVRKRRTLINDCDLSLVPRPPDPAWPGHWFQLRRETCRLQPACQVSYLRVAFGGRCGEGSLRLTLDRSLRCAPVAEWHVSTVAAGLPLLAGQTLLELKFRARLPAVFKQLMQDFGLNPSPVSKYRLAIRAWGPAPSEPRA